MAWHANDRRHEHGGNPAVKETLLRTRERGSVGARSCQANSRCNVARQEIRGLWDQCRTATSSSWLCCLICRRARDSSLELFTILRSFAAYSNSLEEIFEGSER